MISKTVQQAREKFRKDHNIEKYSGVMHLSLTLGVSLVVVGLCVSMLNQIAPLEWLTVPIVFLYSNLSEYLGHKGPMHHKTKFLSLIYKRHALEHHSFFTQDATTIESPKDFKAILFPPVMLVFFFGCFALPVGAAVYLLLSPNVAFLFVITSVLYFLNYELLHLAYHLDPDGWVAQLPFLKTLRHHHTLHHDQRLMSRYNFNITYPIFDLLLGTSYKEGRS